MSYDIKETLSLIEAIINEVSIEKHGKLVKKLEDAIEGAIQRRDMAATKVEKDKMDDIIVPEKHRLEVSKSKRGDRVVKKAAEQKESKEEGK